MTTQIWVNIGSGNRLDAWWHQALPKAMLTSHQWVSVVFTWEQFHRSFCSVFHTFQNNGQGWGKFHFFNSIPIPILLFSIPIPIPLLTISFNSNSNSGDFNSNSNSRDFKSRQSQFQKWPVDVFLEIYYNYTNNVHVYKIIVINTISFISLVKWL